MPDNPPDPKKPTPPPTPSGTVSLPKAPTRLIPGIRRPTASGKVIVTLSSVAKPPPAGTQSLVPPPLPKMAEPAPAALAEPTSVPPPASTAAAPPTPAPMVTAPPKTAPVTPAQMMKAPPPLPPKLGTPAKPLTQSQLRSQPNIVTLPPKTADPKSTFSSTLSGKLPAPVAGTVPPLAAKASPASSGVTPPPLPAKKAQNISRKTGAHPIPPIKLNEPEVTGPGDDSIFAPADTSKPTAAPTGWKNLEPGELPRPEGGLGKVDPFERSQRLQPLPPQPPVKPMVATPTSPLVPPTPVPAQARELPAAQPPEPKTEPKTPEIKKPQGSLIAPALRPPTQRLNIPLKPPTGPVTPVPATPKPVVQGKPPQFPTIAPPLRPPTQRITLPTTPTPEPVAVKPIPSAAPKTPAPIEAKAPTAKLPPPLPVTPPAAKAPEPLKPKETPVLQSRESLSPPSTRIPFESPVTPTQPEPPAAKAPEPLKPAGLVPVQSRPSFSPPSTRIPLEPLATPTQPEPPAAKAPEPAKPAEVTPAEARALVSPPSTRIPFEPLVTPKAPESPTAKAPEPAKPTEVTPSQARALVSPPSTRIPFEAPETPKAPVPSVAKPVEPAKPETPLHEIAKAPPLIEKAAEPVAEKLPPPHVLVEPPHEVAKAPPLVEKASEPAAEKLPAPHLPGETPRTEAKAEPPATPAAKPTAVRPAEVKPDASDRSIMSRTSALAKSATDWLKKTASLKPPEPKPLPPPIFETKPEPKPALKAPVLPKRIAAKEAETVALSAIAPIVEPLVTPAKPPPLPAAAKATPPSPVEAKEAPKNAKPEEVIVPAPSEKPADKESPAAKDKPATPSTPPPLPVTAKEQAPATKPPETKEPEAKPAEIKPAEIRAPAIPVVSADKAAQISSQLRPFEVPTKEISALAPLAGAAGALGLTEEAKRPFVPPSDPDKKEIPILERRERTIPEPKVPAPFKTAPPEKGLAAKAPAKTAAPKAPPAPKPEKKTIPLTRAERAKRRRLMQTVFFWAFCFPAALAALICGSLWFGRDTRIEGQIVPPPGMALSSEVWIVTDFSSYAAGIAEDLAEERAPLEQEIAERQQHVQRAQADVAAREERIRIIQQEVDSSKAEIAATVKDARDQTQAIWDGEGASIDNEYEQKTADLKKAIADRAASLHLNYAPDESFQSPEVWANAYRLALYQVPAGVDSTKEHQWLEDQLKAWRDLTKSLDDRKEQLREKAAQIKLAPGPKIADLNNKIEDLQARIDSTLAEEDPLKAELQQAQADLVVAQAADASLDDKYYKELYALPEPSVVNHIRIPIKDNGRFTWIDDSPWVAGETSHHYYIFSRAYRADGRQYWALHDFTIQKNQLVQLIFEPGGFISTKAILRPNLSPDEQEE